MADAAAGVTADAEVVVSGEWAVLAVFEVWAFVEYSASVPGVCLAFQFCSGESLQELWMAAPVWWVSLVCRRQQEGLSQVGLPAIMCILFFSCLRFLLVISIRLYKCQNVTSFLVF